MQPESDVLYKLGLIQWTSKSHQCQPILEVQEYNRHKHGKGLWWLFAFDTYLWCIVFKISVWSGLFALFGCDQTRTGLWEVEIYCNRNRNWLRPQLQLPRNHHESLWSVGTHKYTRGNTCEFITHGSRSPVSHGSARVWVGVYSDMGKPVSYLHNGVLHHPSLLDAQRSSSVRILGSQYIFFFPIWVSHVCVQILVSLFSTA